MRFADLTYEEIRRDAAAGATAFVPLGCTEQQGPHMPVGFDTMMVEAMAVAIAELVESVQRRSVLVLPTLPFGPTPEHAGFGAGYVNLRQPTHEAIVEDVLRSLANQGFKTIIVWRGCGQHDLARVIELFNATHETSHAWQPVLDYPSIADQAFGRRIAGGHADSFATSICLLLRPAAVRSELIARPNMKPFEWGSEMDFAAISDTGVIGDPTAASLDAGRRLWDLIIAEGASVVRAIAEGRGGEVRGSWRMRNDSTDE
ncbi:MAG: creatininase family protein [Dehalococcoidia bacterium]|nr:MAG: creatininase family protein [Dehalococcoidia bacterium]